MINIANYKKNKLLTLIILFGMMFYNTVVYSATHIRIIGINEKINTLHNNIRLKKYSALKAMIKLNADIEEEIGNGETPILYAAKLGDIEALKY